MNREKQALNDQIREAAYEWYLILSGGCATEEDLRSHANWLAQDPRHGDAYDRAVTVWAALGEVDKADLDPRAIAVKPQRALRPSMFGLRHWRKGLVGAAAALSILVIGFATIQKSPATSSPQIDHVLFAQSFMTGVAETDSVTLEDDSTITLGARTRVSVTLSERERLIELESGAAIFNVAKDPGRPFRVKTGAVSATALGTVFEVRNNGGLVRVLVDEGRVRVAEPFWLDGAATSLIHRNELGAGDHVSAVFGERMSKPSATNTGAFGAWQEGRLEYIGATLSELVADANRYSTQPISIADNIGNLSETRITAFFESGDIDAMLLTLQDLYPIVIDRSGPEIIIRAAP